MSKRIPSLFLASLASLALASCQQTHTHTYDLESPIWEWSQFSSATVSFLCKDCDESAEGHSTTVDAVITVKEAKAATCETAGYKIYEATASYEGQTYTDTKTQPVPASGHGVDNSAWHYDETKHWHDCLYCGDSYHFDEEEHSMTEWTELVAPTYHEEGSREKHCTECPYTITESIAKLRYTYEEVKAFADAFMGFDSDSVYLGRSLDSLLDGLENMNEEDKAAHADEVAEWEKAASSVKESYQAYYKIALDSEGLNTYANTKTEVTFDQEYGTVLKVNADEDSVKGECWTYGPDRKASLLQEGISAVRFAIFAPQPMNVTLVNGKCDTWLDASTGEVVNAQKETTIAGGTWHEFTIPTSAIEKMDTFHIGLYLSPSPFIGYGIPTQSESAEKGSAYVSEIIGVKDAYYADMAEAVDSAIDELSKVTLTMWLGADIRALRSDYETLPESAKALVKNIDVLKGIEDSYAEKWTCYNYSWGQGQVYKSTAISSSTIGHDETYGVYTEFEATDTWIVHFTPDSADAITGAVKMAIYKPDDAAVSAYLIDNAWGNSSTQSLTEGWNIVEIPSATFLNGVANGVSVGLANLKDASGYKFTALYSEK